MTVKRSPEPSSCCLRRQDELRLRKGYVPVMDKPMGFSFKVNIEMRMPESGRLSHTFFKVSLHMWGL